MAIASSRDPFEDEIKLANEMKIDAQNKQSAANVRGRRGIAEAVERAAAGFLTPAPLVPILLTADGPLPIPNPIGKPSRAAEAS